MDSELIRTIRNILLRTALICFVMNLLMAFATFALWETWVPISVQQFHISTEALGIQMFNFFAMTKFFFLFVLLAPALALHWTIKTSK